jgi:two-component system chemotaxis response regulator CheB
MHRLVVIGASAGGVQALQALVRALPEDFAAPVVAVQHVGAHRSVLPELLSLRSQRVATHARDGDVLEAGRIYIAPPDRHVMVVGDTLRLNHGPKEHHTRPAIDPLFRSAALSHGPGVIGVVLTGMLDDGTAGLQAIKRCDGIAIVQDPRDAMEPSMPASALRYVEVDHCVPLASMPGLLGRLAATPPRPLESPDLAVVAHEHGLSLSEGSVMEHLTAIGKPSPFACPDCHGGLWELSNVRPRRFRCHTGHAFTLRSLQHVLATTSDDALWNAFRALEERALLVEEMIESSLEAGQAEESVDLRVVADDLNRRARELRSLLEHVPDPIE